MKKYILISVMVLAICGMFATNYQLSGYSGTTKRVPQKQGLFFQSVLGIDFSGEHEVEWDEAKVSYDVSTGISPSIEMLKQNNQFIYGLGLEYQLPREVDASFEGGKPKFGFLPLYLIGKYKLPFQMNFETEGVLHLGYNAFMHDKKYADDEEYYVNSNDYGSYEYDSSGGLYWGLGVSALFQQRFVVQLMYKLNNASMDVHWSEYYYGDWDEESYSFDISNSQLQLGLGIRF